MHDGESLYSLWEVSIHGCVLLNIFFLQNKMISVLQSPRTERYVYACFSPSPSLSEVMATHSITLAWKIPWKEKPGGLRSMGSRRIGHDWATSLSLFTFMQLEKEMAAHPRALALRIPERMEPGGLPSMGSHRVRNNWSDSWSSSRSSPLSYYSFCM